MNPLQHLSQGKRKKRQAGARSFGHPVALIAVMLLSMMYTA